MGLVASGVGVALGFECMGKMGNPGVVFRPLADAGDVGGALPALAHG